jgi:RNA polymerase sigma-70 factor (ECF subfamily)
MPITAEAITSSEEFSRQAEPLRRELLVHCYRMLGSLVDAEDAVQETFLRGWRAFGRFEGRSSVRVWLYQIATNACLRAIEQRSRRALPSGLGAPSDEPYRSLELASPETTWLQPLPSDPADVVTGRERVRLAFVAAMQHLPARQRAVLILRDVLDLPATEVADLLDTSTTAVNSALARARAHLGRATPEAVDDLDDPALRTLLDRYVAAFEQADLAALEQIMRDDVALEMPPFATWFAGRAAVLSFLRSRVLNRPGWFRFVATTANGQPALASYLLGDDGHYHAHALHVLHATAAGIERIVVFIDPELFATFALPRTYTDGSSSAYSRARRKSAVPQGPAPCLPFHTTSA